MKAIKIIIILGLVYVGIVALFESLIGYLQPQGDETLALISRDAEGNEYTRVLSRIELDGRLYVAVNHWPRAWYHRVFENPAVEITFSGGTADYKAVRVTDETEANNVRMERPLGLMIRILTGFPPRYFVRMDPVVTTASPLLEAPEV